MFWYPTSPPPPPRSDSIFGRSYPHPLIRGRGEGGFSSNSTSNSNIEQKCKEGFRDQVFFFQGKTNSCGVLTAYFGKETLLKNIYVYSAYADDTTFSLKNVISIKHMVDTFFCIYPD